MRLKLDDIDAAWTTVVVEASKGVVLEMEEKPDETLGVGGLSPVEQAANPK